MRERGRGRGRRAPRVPTQAESIVSQWEGRARANGGSPTAVDRAALVPLAYACLVNGLSDANARVNPFAGPDLASALTPLLRGGGANSDTNFGFVGGDYSRSTGLTGDGSSYLDTGIPQSDHPTDDCHLGVYRRTDPGGYRADIGSDGALFRALTSIAGTPTPYRYYCGSGAGNFASYQPAETGMQFGVNQAALEPVMYSQGSAKASPTITLSETPSALTEFVFAVNRSGAVDISTVSLGGYSIGPGLSASAVAALSTAWQTYCTAVGRQV